MAILLVDEVCTSFKGKLHLRMDVTFVDHIVRVSRLRLDWTRCTKDIPDNQIGNVAAHQNCLTADPSISRRNALFLKNLRGHLSDSSKVVTTSQVNCSSLTRSTCAETCQVNCGAPPEASRGSRRDSSCVNVDPYFDVMTV